MNLFGKRFVFSIIAVICVSVTSIMLKFDGDIYLKLVTAITGIFVLGQSVTDYKGGGK